jgi:hypothetical protein
MPQMVVGEKNHQKASDVKYRKVLNKKDPFDQLIMELGEKGVIDVDIVGIGEEPSIPTERKQSRKPVPSRGKHRS